jgi:multimeric flavodoxin WrbA
MGRILVTYYSRSGHTREVAEYAAAKCGADLTPILEVKPRSGGFWGNALTTLETLRGHPSALQQCRINVADYDIVLFGTQVWAGSINPPARAFAEAYGAQLKRYALFCTLGGMGSQRAFGQFERLVGHPAERSLAIPQRLLPGEAFKPTVDAFLSGL